MCVDDSFGKVPHSDEYTAMFDNKGKDLQSKLKLSYKTNLNVLNQQGQDISSLVANSFFSNETEKKKMLALQQKSKLVPRLAAIDDLACEVDVPDSIATYETLLSEVRSLNYQINKLRNKLEPFSVV